MKDADDCGITAFENARDAAEAATIGTRRREFDQHLVTLHGPVDLVGRDEDVIFFWGTLAGVGPHESIAVTMQIEPTGDEIVARPAAGFLGNAPVLAIGFDKVAARGDAGELLEKQAAFATPAEAQFTHQLLVSGFAACGARDLRQQFPIGHSLRVGQRSGSWEVRCQENSGFFALQSCLAFRKSTGRANGAARPASPQGKLFTAS